MNHSLEFLKAHSFDCIQNRDMWQAELNATVQAIKDYKEPEKEEVKEPVEDKKTNEK